MNIENWEPYKIRDEEFNNQMKERVKDLHKSYKYVMICKGCNHKFGRDTKGKHTSKYCPICTKEFQFGGESPWDRNRQRFKEKDDSGGSNKARGTSDD